VRSNAAGFLRSADPEFLHQLRVGMRRMRAALRAFRRAIPHRASKSVARRFKALSAPLGAARDWDVLCEWLAGEKSLSLDVQARRDAARQRARQGVRSRQFAEALASADALAHRTIEDEPLSKLAGHALRKSHRRVMKAGSDLDLDDHAARHALRIRAKQLRYCCEYFSPFYGAGAGYIEKLKALQEILGQLNDAAVGRRLLDDLPGIPPALRSRLRTREARLLRRLPRAWDAFQATPPFWMAAR
jgi:CHAD domain-containing protein